MKSVANVLLVQNGKMLLLHNKKHKIPRVEVPGGKVEEGEKAEECAIRESNEECDIQVEITGFFGKFYTIAENGEKYEVYTFIGNILKGQPKIMESDKFSNIGWYSFSDILKFKEDKTLAPNLVDGLDQLKKLF